MCAQHPSLMLVHFPNICSRSHAFSIPTTSIMPSVGRLLFFVTLFPQYHSAALLLWLSQCWTCRAGVNALECPVRVPGYHGQRHSQTCIACSLGFSPTGMCRDTKSRVLHAKLGQAEKHRTMTNCAGMCAQHTARADTWCQIKRAYREIH